MQKSLLLVALLWGQLGILAQPLLLLEHHKNDRQLAFYVGDYIRVQLQSDRSRHGGFIEAVIDSVIVLQKAVAFQMQGAFTENIYREVIQIKDIRLLYKTHETIWDTYRGTFYATAMMGGSALISITAVNTLIHGVAPPFGTFMLIGSLLVTGFIIKYAGRDHYKIGKRWHFSFVVSTLGERPEMR